MLNLVDNLNFLLSILNNIFYCRCIYLFGCFSYYHWINCIIIIEVNTWSSGNLEILCFILSLFLVFIQFVLRITSILVTQYFHWVNLIAVCQSPLNISFYWVELWFNITQYNIQNINVIVRQECFEIIFRLKFLQKIEFIFFCFMITVWTALTF